MRPRQHGEGSKPLRIPVSDEPGNAAAPVMAHQMETALRPAYRGDNVHRIADQLIHFIVGDIGRVGPRFGGITALVGRHGIEPGIAQSLHLGIPQVSRHAEPVQHQHERCLFIAGDRGIERQPGCSRDPARLDHLSVPSSWSRKTARWPAGSQPRVVRIFPRWPRVNGGDRLVVLPWHWREDHDRTSAAAYLFRRRRWQIVRTPAS